MICGMMTLQNSTAPAVCTNHIYYAGGTLNNDVNDIDIGSGIFDTLYVSAPNEDITTPITGEDAANLRWGIPTILFAKFNNSLSAGNLMVDYLQEQIVAVVIKRREHNVINDWITVKKIPVFGVDDMKFSTQDYYAQANTTYEYSYGVILNAAETELDMQVHKVIHSDFDGVYILDKDHVFNTPLDITFSSSKTHPSEILQPINSKFPYYVSNGGCNYYTGSISGVFIQLDTDTCEWLTDEGVGYRYDLMNFLCDGKPKILKYRDGRTWIIGITESPSESDQDHFDKVQTSFSWAQIGDANNFDDLYNNGFFDWEV